VERRTPRKTFRRHQALETVGQIHRAQNSCGQKSRRAERPQTRAPLCGISGMGCAVRETTAFPDTGKKSRAL